MSLLIAALTGLLAFLGSAAGHLVARLTAREQERSRQREETMRLLRWGAEMATDPSAHRREVGVTTLGELARSPLLNSDDFVMVGAVMVAASRRATIYTHQEEAK